MNNFIYLSSVIAVLALVTFVTRLLPFVLLYKVSEHPLLAHLGRYLPAMVMVLLVIYSFKGESLISTDFLPELACLLLVLILHLSIKNSLVSIVGATAVYMLLRQMGYA